MCADCYKTLHGNSRVLYTIHIVSIQFNSKINLKNNSIQFVYFVKKNQFNSIHQVFNSIHFRHIVSKATFATLSYRPVSWAGQRGSQYPPEGQPGPWGNYLLDFLSPLCFFFFFCFFFFCWVSSIPYNPTLTFRDRASPLMPFLEIPF